MCHPLPYCLLFCCLIMACDRNETGDSGKTTSLSTSTTNETSNGPPTSTPLITKAGYLGLRPGNSITDKLDMLRRATAKNGEPIYLIITPEGQGGGFVYPAPDDPNRIGSVVVTSLQAATRDGVKMGLKLAELRRLYPGIESVRGTTKGTTQVTIGRLRYEFATQDDLDVYDQAIIDETSRLRSITILP